MRVLIYTQLALRERWEHATGRDRQRGSALEWVLITAGMAVLVGIIYAAIRTKALEKIDLIQGA